MSPFRKKDDKFLITRIRDNDLEAFGALYDRYKRKIYAFSFKYIRNKPESEDVVQNVFINLWEHRKSLDENQPVRSYIYRSVVNAIYNIYKRKAVRSKYMEHELLKHDSYSESTYETVLRNDLEENIEKIVTGLPPRQQKIFRLSRANNFSNEEIADKLDLSVRTVENQIYRTLKVIRKNLTDRS